MCSGWKKGFTGFAAGKVVEVIDYQSTTKQENSFKSSIKIVTLIYFSIKPILNNFCRKGVTISSGAFAMYFRARSFADFGRPIR